MPVHRYVDTPTAPRHALHRTCTHHTRGSQPAQPTDQHATAGGKDAWGHLPPELRQELDNLFKEDSLPAAQELIRRYYLSVSRKKLVRGE